MDAYRILSKWGKGYIVAKANEKCLSRLNKKLGRGSSLASNRRGTLGKRRQ